MRFVFVSGRMYNPADLQWAPTLRSHDPNPPLPLEDPLNPAENETTGHYIGAPIGGVIWAGIVAPIISTGGLHHIDRGMGDTGEERIPQTLHTINEGISA
jgi:hypothetical protein